MHGARNSGVYADNVEVERVSISSDSEVSRKGHGDAVKRGYPTVERCRVENVVVK